MSEAGPATSYEARYQIRRELGHGGFGSVFEAWDVEARRAVALKIVSGPATDELVHVESGLMAISGAGHPNIAGVHAVHHGDDGGAVAMELVRGVSFDRWLGLDRPPPQTYLTRVEGARGLTPQAVAPTGEVVAPTTLEPDDLLTLALPDEPGELARLEATRAPYGAGVRPRTSTRRLRRAFGQLVEGLAWLHHMGQLHRDVKPSNVLVSGDGVVKLIDFGLLTPIDQACAPSCISGTPSYIAPELCEGGCASPASDWYSVGVVLFLALTGTLPFAGPAQDVMRAKCVLPAPRPCRVARKVPRDLDRLCSALLTRDPRARPSTAALRRAFARRPTKTGLRACA